MTTASRSRSRGAKITAALPLLVTFGCLLSKNNSPAGYDQHTDSAQLFVCFSSLAKRKRGENSEHLCSGRRKEKCVVGVVRRRVSGYADVPHCLKEDISFLSICFPLLHRRDFL